MPSPRLPRLTPSQAQVIPFAECAASSLRSDDSHQFLCRLWAETDAHPLTSSANPLAWFAPGSQARQMRNDFFFASRKIVAYPGDSRPAVRRIPFALVCSRARTRSLHPSQQLRCEPASPTTWRKRAASSTSDGRKR